MKASIFFLVLITIFLIGCGLNENKHIESREKGNKTLSIYRMFEYQRFELKEKNRHPIILFDYETFNIWDGDDYVRFHYEGMLIDVYFNRHVLVHNYPNKIPQTKEKEYIIRAKEIFDECVNF